jgi:hypothetical protein
MGSYMGRCRRVGIANTQNAISMTVDCGSKQELRGGDVVMAALFFAAAVALRVPFRSQLAYHWDSAQFALAVGEYNIQISQPHAPGFYLYVALGRLVNFFVGEPHAALVWLSVIAGACLAAVGYLLATSMFGRKCGMGTGLILLTSPLCWFHSEIALTTIVDSALVVSFVFVCWQAIRAGVTWGQAILLAVLLAAIAGIRQQSAPLLIPLWFYVFCGFARPRGQKLAGATAVAFVLSLFWFIPTVKSAGGLASYIHLLRLKGQFDARITVWGGRGMDAFLANASAIGKVCWAGLLGAGIIAAVEFVHWVVFECLFSKKTANEECSWQANKTQLCVLVCWFLPMLLFWLFMYVTMPGYTLNFFPALAILAGLGLARFSERVVTPVPHRNSWSFYGVLAIVAMINVATFVISPQGTTRLLMGVPLTAEEVQEHDAKLAACFRMIRQQWPSKNVTICHRYEDFYWGFRQFEYYLPEYKNVLLTTDSSLPGIAGTQEWIGYGHRTIFVMEAVMTERRDVLLVVPPRESVNIFKSRFDLRNATLISDFGPKLYVLHP